jgi:predicted phage terminase large subunit-like protein
MTSPTTPGKVNVKQLAFLLLNEVREVGFGGAAGGGKSEGMLQGASQYLDIPGYKAIILRRTFRDLALPGALMDRSMEWWKGTKASWDGNDHKWTFPEGTTLQFGYLEGPQDHLRYQGAEFQFVGFDEATQFELKQYLYLFSRLRRVRGVQVPLRMRSATNPGGPGHEWYRDRFKLPLGPDIGANRAFVFSHLGDNPYLDQEEYTEALSELDPTTQAQLLAGDWSALASGGKFDPSQIQWHEPNEMPPAHEFQSVVRYWDLAGTEPNDVNPDPDWTVGVKLGMTRFGSQTLDLPDWWILDVARCRHEPRKTEQFVHMIANRDGRAIPQWFEQERGGAGKLLVSSFRNNVLPYHEVNGLYVTGDKETRAQEPAARMNEGRFHGIYGPWNEPYAIELRIFPEGSHDDQVDGTSGAFIACQRQVQMRVTSTVKEY